MKTAGVCFIVFVPLFLSACNNNEKQKQRSANADMTMNKAQSKNCYVAVDNKDSAFLNLNTYAKGKVKGNLTFKYHDKAKNAGSVDGSYSGDSLYVDYVFMIGDQKRTYKNPLAFLKRDGNLVLGVGEIITYLGKSYLDKKTPIDYSKGRFVFKPGTCK
jgi:hypothetical protein